jgi:hypothetical protein
MELIILLFVIACIVGLGCLFYKIWNAGSSSDDDDDTGYLGGFNLF